MKMFRLLAFESGLFSIIALTLAFGSAFLISEPQVYLITVLVGIFMIVVGPKKKRYLGLGLDSDLWRRHRLISLWLHAVVFSTVALIGGLITEPIWIAAAVPIVIALLRSVLIPQGREVQPRAYGSMKEVHLRLWRDIWAGNIAALVAIWVVGIWRGEGFDLIPVLGFTTFLFIALMMGGGGVLRVSLRQWIALGGTRDEWFNKAVRFASVNLAGIAALFVLLTLISDGKGAQLTAALLFPPLIILSVNLADKKMAWLPILGIALGLLVCAPIGWPSIPLALLGVIVMLWGIRTAARGAEAFNPGFVGWLGMAERVV